jgi:hypothetical protein
MQRTVKPSQLFDTGRTERRESEQQEQFNNAIINISEQAFRKYAKAHKASAELEELEWQRYKKILQSTLRK